MNSEEMVSKELEIEELEQVEAPGVLIGD
jgi:hypothetical protein